MAIENSMAIEISVSPFCSGSDPVDLAAENILFFLVEIRYHTPILKLMKPLQLLSAEVKL